MIGQVKGRVLDRWDMGVVLDVNGLGYEIQMPASAAAKFPPSDKDIIIYTHLVWREDTLSLYGFESKEGRDMFRLLLQVSGVGPKVAISILSMLGPRELVEILATGDHKRLQAIHGVGKKTAARLCVDLKEKAKTMQASGHMHQSEPAPTPKEGQAIYQDALSALINLGYKQSEASKAIRNTLKQLKNGAPTLEELVKAALQALIKKQEPRK